MPRVFGGFTPRLVAAEGLETGCRAEGVLQGSRQAPDLHRSGASIKQNLAGLAGRAARGHYIIHQHQMAALNVGLTTEGFTQIALTLATGQPLLMRCGSLADQCGQDRALPDLA